MRALRCPAAQQAARQLFAWQENAWAAAASGTSSGRGFGSGECSCSADSSGGGGWGGVSSNSGSSGKGSGGGVGGDRNGFAMGSSRCRSYSTDTRNPASDPQDKTALQGQESDLASSSSGAEAFGLVAAQQRPWHWVQEPAELSDTVTVNISSADLGPDHTGLYYPFDASRVPEAFQAFHQAFYPARPQNLQRKGGCRGLQAEIATAGTPPHLMWRAATQQLADVLDRPGPLPSTDADADAGAGSGASSTPRPVRVLLRGPAGSGKSIALAALVERARARGELVVYVPDARALVSGGFFYKRPETGTYDTIISAQHILKSVLDSHRAQLEAMPRRVSAPTPAGGATGEAAAKAGAAVGAAGGGAGSLLDLVLAGLSTDDDARMAVGCCLSLIRELVAAAASPDRAAEGAPAVLFAIDNYGALYRPTDYGETAFETAPSGAPYLRRRQLEVSELNLASSMRLLNWRNLGRARVVAATSATGGVPLDTQIPLRKSVLQYEMPRFSPIEVAHLLHFYHERGLVEAPSAAQVDKLRAITNGSGADLRRLGLRSAQLDTNVL